MHLAGTSNEKMENASRRLALEVLANNPELRGICRFCGCTDRNACVIPREDGDVTCSWANPEHTLCTAPGCLIQEGREANDVIPLLGTVS